MKRRTNAGPFASVTETPLIGLTLSRQLSLVLHAWDCSDVERNVQNHTLADPDIRPGGPETQTFGQGANLICFLVSHAYFFVGGEPMSRAKLNVGPWPDSSPLDSPLKPHAFYLCRHHA